MEKYDIQFPQLLAGRYSLLREVAFEKVAERTNERLTGLMIELESRFSQLPLLISPEDGIGEAVETARTKIFYQLGKLKGKLLSAGQMRRETAERHIARLCNSLFPEGCLQEQQLGGLQFLLRYSRAIIGIIYDKVELTRFEHQLVFLD